jgi:23S rRNA (guanosine2251-2'-O)-methyltransferase
MTSKTFYCGSMQVVSFCVDHCPEMILNLYHVPETAKTVGQWRARLPKKADIQLTSDGKLQAFLKLQTFLKDSEGNRHQGVVAELKWPEGVELGKLESEGPRQTLLVLDHLQDVHNLGAICRSSLLLGAQGIVFPKARGVGITSGAIKASSGALMLNRFHETANVSQCLQALKKRGYWIAGLAAEGSGLNVRKPDELRTFEKLALVVGSEHEGLRRSIVEACDVTVTIPLVTAFQAVSLNASVAAAVVLYALDRART